MAARGKLKKYTVIGYWEEQGDPWLEFGMGYTPEEGMKDALKSAMENNGWDIDFMQGLKILEVVAGHVPGLLLNQELFTGYDALQGPKGVLEWRPEDPE